MGRRSARMVFNTKDHKEIVMNGKYHDAIFIGSNVSWFKIGEGVQQLTETPYGIDLSIQWTADENYIIFWVCDSDEEGTRAYSIKDKSCSFVTTNDGGQPYPIIDNMGYILGGYDFDSPYLKVSWLNDKMGNRLYVTPSGVNMSGLNANVKAIYLSNGLIFYPVREYKTATANLTSVGTVFNVPYAYQNVRDLQNWVNGEETTVWMMFSNTEKTYCYSSFCTDAETRTKLYAFRHTKGSASDFSDMLIELVELNPDIDETASIDSFEVVRTLFSITGAYNTTLYGTRGVFMNPLFRCANNRLIFSLTLDNEPTFYVADLENGTVSEYNGPISVPQDIRYDKNSGKYIISGNGYDESVSTSNMLGCIAITSDFEKWEITSLFDEFSHSVFAGKKLIFSSGNYFYSFNTSTVVYGGR